MYSIIFYLNLKIHELHYQKNQTKSPQLTIPHEKYALFDGTQLRHAETMNVWDHLELLSRAGY